MKSEFSLFTQTTIQTGCLLKNYFRERPPWTSCLQWEKLQIHHTSLSKQLTVANCIGKLRPTLELEEHKIDNTIRAKKDVLHAYNNGSNNDTKHMAPRTFPNCDIDVKVWSYFCECRSKCMPVTGPMLKQEAHRVALLLGKDEFLTSNEQCMI